MPAANLRGINTLMLDFTDDPGVRQRPDGILRGHGIELRARAGGGRRGPDRHGRPLVIHRRPWLYEQFCGRIQKKIVDGVRALGAKVRVHICGNTRKSLDLLGQLGADILDVDSMVPIAEAREKSGPEQVLLGGIDPVRTLSHRYARAGRPRASANAIASPDRATSPAPGCEVPPEVPDAKPDCSRRISDNGGTGRLHDSGPIRNSRTNL